MFFKVQKKILSVVSLFTVAFWLYIFNITIFANLFFAFGLFTLLLASISNPELLVISLIIIETKLFGVGPEKIAGMQPEKIEVFVVIFSYILWAISSKFTKRSQIPKSYLLLLYTVVLIVSSAIMAQVTVGQSIIIGILLQTRLLVIFSVFPIISLMNNKLLSYDRLWNLIKKVAILQSFINILQLFFYPNIQFLTITSENFRFGSIRITYGYVLIATALMMCFSELMKKIEKKNIFYFLIYMYELLFVCKARMVVFGVLISMFLVFISSLKNKAAWRRALILGICFILITPIISPRISELFDLTQQEVSTNTGNYVARTGEVEFYTSQVKNPILGRGFISPKTKGGEIFDTKYGYYSLTDIGIIALYVISGVVGLIWFFILIVILIERLKKSKFNIFGLEYLVYSVVTCMTLLSSYYQSEYLILSLILLAAPKIAEEEV